MVTARHLQAKGRKVLLTGATGIVGSELLVRLLRAGAAVTVVIRDAANAPADARLAAVLAYAGAGDGKVDILRRDLLSPQPLSSDERARLREVNDVVHCAALTRFDPLLADELSRVNVRASLELFDVLAESRAHFHHVSTSYVAGTSSQPFSERQLDVGQSFQNPYERSKFEAERQLRRRAEERGLGLHIYRPSIVVGASDSGRIAAFTSVYPFLRLSLSKFEQTVRVRGRLDTPLDLVPVDWVADALLHLMLSAPSTAQVFQLTNPHPPRLQHISDWARAYAPSCRVEIHPELERPTRIERHLHHQLRHYAPYLASSPTFDSSATEALLPEALRCPRLTSEHYARWLGYAEQRNWRDLGA